MRRCWPILPQEPNQIITGLFPHKLRGLMLNLLFNSARLSSYSSLIGMQYVPLSQPRSFTVFEQEEHSSIAIYRVYLKSGCLSPIGALVSPASQSSWYFSRLLSLLPAARAEFSHLQYSLYLGSVMGTHLTVAYSHIEAYHEPRKAQESQAYGSLFRGPMGRFTIWSRRTY